jgi:HD-like signal output (HDOD) protein
MFHVDPHLGHVGALLHDLGRLGLLSAHPAEYSVIALAAYDSTEQILAAEQAAFGMTHCQAGALLAKAWSLPEPLRQVARKHHDASSEEGVVGLAQFSCRIADDWMYQAIMRRDSQKPEETIATYAPSNLWESFTSELETVNALVIAAIQALDF